MTRRNATFAALLCLSPLMASCSSEDVGYLIRAAYEEARILARRRPIDEILATDEIDDTTRAKLELSLAAREFAENPLGLNAGGSYRTIASIDQDQVIHVVSAAYRDRLEPYTWWFPIVGAVPYRGYFHAESAQTLAETMEGEGYDTYVRRALAFSTLGYFDDPLLSHLLRDSDEELVETILHELLHSTAYFAGQATFNESFANFVGHRGAIAFFTARRRDVEARRARDRWDDARQFSEFLTDVLERLDAAYRSGVDLEEREQLFADARMRYQDRSWRTGEYDRFASGPINNAVLLSRRVYFDRLALFDDVLQRFGGDLTPAIEWIIAAARSDPDAYRGVERALASQHDGEAPKANP